MINYVIIGTIVFIIILLCVCLAIASFASENYFVELERTQKIRNSSGKATLEIVDDINQNYFSGKIKIARCKDYEDHYSNGVIALSNATMISNSLASVATIAHELGHAKQNNESGKLEKLYRLRRVGKVFSLFFMPLVLAGGVISGLYLFEVLVETYYLYIGIGLVALGLITFLFVLYEKYKEISIEKEASVFALEFLKEFLSEDEISICKDFLNSARLTYWADFFKTLLSWTLLTKKNRR